MITEHSLNITDPTDPLDADVLSVGHSDPQHVRAAEAHWLDDIEFKERLEAIQSANGHDRWQRLDFTYAHNGALHKDFPAPR